MPIVNEKSAAPQGLSQIGHIAQFGHLGRGPCDPRPGLSVHHPPIDAVLRLRDPDTLGGNDGGKRNLAVEHDATGAAVADGRAEQVNRGTTAASVATDRAGRVLAHAVRAAE